MEQKTADTIVGMVFIVLIIALTVIWGSIIIKGVISFQNNNGSDVHPTGVINDSKQDKFESKKPLKLVCCEYEADWVNRVWVKNARCITWCEA